MSDRPSPRVAWPEGRAFAFTVFDDTDLGTLQNLPEVYAFLRDQGFRTTKSVWPLLGTDGGGTAAGATCADGPYLGWLRGLHEQGFEIGYHNATWHSSPRADTQRALDHFGELFGGAPRCMANHMSCEEGIYWGRDRVTGPHRVLYDLLTLGRGRRFGGHRPGDRFFWGDLCRERIRYVRNFTFADLNTLRACPYMPYHDPRRPYVNLWYASSEGGDVTAFNRTLAEARQDRLEEEGGAAILYVHFAKGFRGPTGLERRFRALLERLARKNGWFVPVSRLLDHLVEARGAHTLRDAERRGLERRWLLHKMAVGST
jgi:hypothetical protein